MASVEGWSVAVVRRAGNPRGRRRQRSRCQKSPVGCGNSSLLPAGTGASSCAVAAPGQSGSGVGATW